MARASQTWPRPRVMSLHEDRPRIVERTILPLWQPQHEFVTDFDTNTLLFLGGLGSGKTTALASFVSVWMQHEAGRGTSGLITANSYQQLEQATLPALWEIFDRMGMVYGEDYVYNSKPPRAWREFHSKYKKHGNILSVRDWGQALVRSLDNYDVSLRGIEVGWVAGDEIRDASIEAFRVLIGRVRCKRASKKLIRLGTTPSGFNWLHDEFEEKPLHNPKLAALRKTIRATTFDNPALGADYVESIMAAYDSQTVQQEVFGKYVSVAQGMAYHQFDRKIHVDPRLRPDPNREWLVTFDFNRSPFMVIIGQRNAIGDGIVALDEVCLLNAGTEEACREVLNRIAAFERTWQEEGYDTRPMVEVFGDPAGRQRRTNSNHSDYDVITRDLGGPLGGRFQKRWKEQDPGFIARVNAVNGLFRNAYGAVRAAVHPRCRMLIRDLERVRFLTGTTILDKTDKSLTHASDAWAYLCERLFPVRRMGARMQTV